MTNEIKTIAFWDWQDPLPTSRGTKNNWVGVLEIPKGARFKLFYRDGTSLKEEIGDMRVISKSGLYDLGHPDF